MAFHPRYRIFSLRLPPFGVLFMKRLPLISGAVVFVKIFLVIFTLPVFKAQVICGRKIFPRAVQAVHTSVLLRTLRH